MKGKLKNRLLGVLLAGMMIVESVDLTALAAESDSTMTEFVSEEQETITSTQSEEQQDTVETVVEEQSSEEMTVEESAEETTHEELEREETVCSVSETEHVTERESEEHSTTLKEEIEIVTDREEMESSVLEVETETTISTKENEIKYPTINSSEIISLWGILTYGEDGKLILKLEDTYLLYGDDDETYLVNEAGLASGSDDNNWFENSEDLINKRVLVTGETVSRHSPYHYRDLMILVENINEEQSLASGQCGDNITWRLENGTLTILGSGEMWDYQGEKDFPWYNFKDEIENLTIENGVTHIGEYSFFKCNKIDCELYLPESITSIGKMAFSGCSGLSGNLIIPEGVTTIENGIFADCNGFTGILGMSKGITVIGDNAFSGCNGLTGNLIIPDTVTYIGSSAFYNCSSFTGNLEIPEKVTEIGSSAFYNCSGLDGNLFISGSVNYIGGSVFNQCSSLSGDLIIPYGITSIGTDAFRGCSGLSGDLIIPYGVTSIGSYAFSGCSGLDGDLVIPNSVTSIEIYAFSGCKGLSGDLIIPDSIINLGYGAFMNCSGFTGSLKIPDHLKRIEDYTFNNCTGLSGNLVLPNTLTYIGSSAFYNCHSFTGDLKIPKGVAEIGHSAFNECMGFNGTLIISEGVKSIGARAFEWCNSFSGNLVIPESVTIIEQFAFNRCTGFDGDLVIPNSTTNIEQYAFNGCRGLGKKLLISSDIQRLDNTAFMGCENIKIIVFTGKVPKSSDNRYFRNVEAIVYCPRSYWDTIKPENQDNKLIWIPYEEGTEPWEIDLAKDAPTIIGMCSTNPDKIVYDEDGFNTLNLSAKASLLYTDIGVIQDIIVYKNVNVTISLSDGLSFDKEMQVKAVSKTIGTMDSKEIPKIDLEPMTIYIDSKQLFEEYNLTFSVECDGYTDKRISNYKIPVIIEQNTADYTIIDAVNKYTSGEQFKPILDIMAGGYSTTIKRRKFFELYNCDNIFDITEQMTYVHDSYIKGKEEAFAYGALINDDMYTSYQWYDYLHNTTKGKVTRGAMFASGLVFNGELNAWLDVGTYLDGNYPGIEKYQRMLEEFINEHNSELEYYAYVKATHKFLNNMVGTISSTQKADFLKLISKTKNKDELKTVFNHVIANIYEKENSTGKVDITIVSKDEKTAFMKAMGITGIVFKISNATMDTIDAYLNLEKNLEVYEVNKAFLVEVVNAKELPWELRAAAYRVIKKYEEGYFEPILEIMRKIRDECIDGILDGTKFDSIMGLGGYLSAINFASYCINQIINIGDLVVNSCQTEGYYLLARHYSDKLKLCSEEFIRNKSEENAWEFYITYNYLRLLRVAGEKKFLAMNKLEGSTTIENMAGFMGISSIADVISECCDYAEKEECINEILDTLNQYKFRYNLSEAKIPEKYQYVQKIVVECPVSVDIYASDGSLICVLPDRQETEIENEYGRFITKYRETTGDYVKIGYLYNNDVSILNMNSQSIGNVNCSIVSTEDHRNCIIKGFDEIQVKEGTIINVMINDEEYAIDEDGDGIADIKESMVDKRKTHVRFVYGESQQEEIVYVDNRGYISMPENPSKAGYTFGGWYTKIDGQGEKFNGSVIVRQNITVYAYWISDEENHRQLPKPSANISNNSTVEKGTKIVLSCGEPDVSIYYTTDGSIPTKQSLLYAQPIELLKDTTIKAFASGNGYVDSEIITLFYAIKSQNENPSEEISSPENPSEETSTDEESSEEKPTEEKPSDEESSEEPSDPSTDKDDSAFTDAERQDLSSFGAVITAIKPKTYNQEEQEPAVKVTVSINGKKTALIEGMDYRVLYKKNINAGTATVTVKGNGIYKGSLTQNFTIRPKSLKKVHVLTGSLQDGTSSGDLERLPIYVYDGGKLLHSGIDYTLSSSGTSSSTVKINITGKGNYTGIIKVKLSVNKAGSAQVISSEHVQLKKDTAVYTGKAVKSIEPVVTVKGTTLTFNKDYKVQYQNNINAGTAYMIVTGKGSYKGKVVVPFTIQPIVVSTSAVSIKSIAAKTYNGKLQKPSVIATVPLGGGAKKLAINKDYKVIYKNNLHAGTATVMIVGKGNYAGMKAQTQFTIQPQKITGVSVKGTQGKLSLTYNNRALKEGVHYELPVYGEIKKNKIKVTIKGKGDFAGQTTKYVKQ